MFGLTFRAPFRTLAALFACAAVASAYGEDLLVGQVSSQTNIVTAMNAKGLYLGMNVYFDSVNARGGINGRQVKVVNKDDDAKAPKMIAMTRELAADKNVIVLAGYQGTGGLTELAKENLLGQLGLALVSPLAGDKSIVGADNIFPFRSGYPDEVTALVKEAAGTGKKKVVLVYWNVAFGPSMVKLAQDVAREQNLNIAATVMMNAAQPERAESAIREAVAATIKAEPDAVIMLMSTRYAADFTAQIKNSPAAGTQLYAMSVMSAAELNKAAGADKARGIVIAQSVPFPFSATLPVEFEYQKLMKQYAPQAELSFASLEGFITGKITAEALRRAGPSPTREKVVKALYAMGEYDLGGVYVDYSAQQRRGWGGVDLTVIGPNGKLLR